MNNQEINYNQYSKTSKNNKSIIVVLIILITLLVSTIVIVSFVKNKNDNLTQKENVDISSQLYSDYMNNNITTDEYIRYLLYTQYDTSMLDKKYQKLLKSDSAINIEDLINKYYKELSTETLNYYAKKINLDNITFELYKENEEQTVDNKITLSDIFIQTVYAKSDKVTNLNKAVLSKNGNFVVWYTTTGSSASNYESALKIANGLEKTISKYDSLFNSKYNYNSNVISKGTTYKNQQKILENSNINPSYLESAMQIYLVNYNDSSLAQYVSGYGKGKEILNSVFGEDSYGTISYPYIIIKPSSFNDFERLEQLYNHEIFHHYQRNILCGKNECSLSSDPYYSDSTANWASALVTNKTTSSGFLNEWSQVYRYNSNSLLGKYINQYGESKAAYAMFVYLYNYSNVVYKGTQKIIEGMYKSNFLKYLEDNSTLQERKNIQKEIALKNLTLNYSNNNLNIPTESRAMVNINDTININKDDVYMKDVAIDKMGVTYFAINLTLDEVIKITIDKDNNYVDAILVAQNESDDYVIIDSSDNKGNQIIFDTNNYKDYQKYYLITYNNNLTLQNYYSLTIKQTKKNDKQENSSNKNYISLINCDAYYSEEIDKRVDTYFFDENNNVKRWVVSIYLKSSMDSSEQYDYFVNHKNYTNVKIKGNLVIAEYTNNALSKYFNNMTRNSVIYSHQTSCSLSCNDEECSWEKNPNLVLNYNPDSVN